MNPTHAERVVHQLHGPGTVTWASCGGGAVEVAFDSGRLVLVPAQCLAPETAARVIPYGDTRCKDPRPTG